MQFLLISDKQKEERFALSSKIDCASCQQVKLSTKHALSLIWAAKCILRNWRILRKIRKSIFSVSTFEWFMRNDKSAKQFWLTRTFEKILDISKMNLSLNSSFETAGNVNSNTFSVHSLIRIVLNQEN